jgi:putative tryptophan/tyrosine transport system substrate-binding protein
MPVIGFLSCASFETMRDYVSVFQQSLADTGFVGGRNVAIEYRWAEGHNDRLGIYMARIRGSRRLDDLRAQPR